MTDTVEAEHTMERLINPEDVQAELPKGPDKSTTALVPHLSRLIRDNKGKFMFIGDSANLSFLQNIRRLVEASIGSCSFTTDPFRYMMVEDGPPGQAHWLDSHLHGPVPKPSLGEATNLINQYILATNCVLDLFDKSELVEHLPQWLDGRPDGSEPFGSMYYLVLAIGAQTSSEDKDDIAELYFNYGRYLTVFRYMEDPSLSSVQSHLLIGMFMLGAARRNAAFMNLGVAARAAYAIGLHKREVSDLFSEAERRSRERTWKVLHILDSFMSTTLGRPYSTSETRDTTSKENYSAAANICEIFEHIATEVYAKRMVSTEVIGKISKEHRAWTARFHEGLKTDGISSSVDLDFGQHPNIGLIHLKEAYYWSIILLTRPFLIEYVSIHIGNSKSTFANGPDKSAAPTNQTFVDACVDSAMSTINLLNVLHRFASIPKRLPFVVNSIFIAALVLGIAFFGDLDRSFPLSRGLHEAQVLLRLFSPHDTLAKRDLVIIEYLYAACNSYVEQRNRQKMDGHKRTIGQIFGMIHEQQDASLRVSPTTTRVSTKFGPNAEKPETYKGPSQSRQRQISPAGAEGFGLDSISGANLDMPSNGHHDDSLGFAGETTDIMLNEFDIYNDHVMEFSPRTLLFDTYEENNPLFSTLPIEEVQGLWEPFNPTDEHLP